MNLENPPEKYIVFEIFSNLSCWDVVNYIVTYYKLLGDFKQISFHITFFLDLLTFHHL